MNPPVGTPPFKGDAGFRGLAAIGYSGLLTMFAGSRRVRRYLAATTILAVLLAAAYAARQSLLIAAGRLLVVNDPAPADYLVVPGGGAETRPFGAADLYRQGLAPRIVIYRHEGDAISALGLTPSHDELYRRVLEMEGVPSHAIEQLPDSVTNSWDEAQALKHFLASRRAARVIVVTSAENTRRSRWLYRKVLAGQNVDVRVAAVRHYRYDETNWWHYDDATLYFLHEYPKLAFYWAYYALPGR